ncbi:TadE/TadG family type IV pilus assembly protein [Sphingomonas sp.]|uniref:TadE/TadG family type IV pilus assembly protein n=1 Tax=Sphingomonas sp. TaxID=28214 RepID=UPI0031E32CA7
MAALWRHARGVAMVEFALTLPVILLLYLGGVQLQDGIACNRKVTIAARAAADLISQNLTGTTTKAEISGDLTAAGQVLLPFTADKAQIRVTELYTDTNLKTTVQWSQGLNTTGRVPGSSPSVPASLQVRNTYFLMAEVTYAYTPPTSFGSIGALTLGDRIYMVPRNTDQIKCSDCSPS